MMDIEVLTPMTPWFSKCGPKKYVKDGFADHHSKPYGIDSSGLETISWLRFAEREILKSPKPRQGVGAPRVVSTPPSSIQIAGKSLLGRGESVWPLQESESIQWYCDKYPDSSLIPGLSEDVAQKCLALVSRLDFPSTRKVCKAWKNLVQTREFYGSRKAAGTLEEWLYFLIESQDMKTSRWEVLNPKQNAEWKSLPRMPGVVKVGSRTVVVNEKLLIIGGMAVGSDDQDSFASPDVYIYCPVLDKWKKGASMREGRYEFACGVVDGKVYAVGGKADGETALSSVEIYDPEKDEWVSTTPLKKARWGCFAAGVSGKLYVIGGRSCFTLGSARFMDVLDPQTQQWHEVKNGCAMVLSHAVLKGKIFCIEWKDQRSLRCYNTADNSWSKIILPLALRCRAGFCLGAVGGKLQFFQRMNNRASHTVVYDPDAPKGSEWQKTSIKPRGACLSCETMTA